MGSVTPILFYNDDWDYIKNNPELVSKQILECMEISHKKRFGNHLMTVGSRHSSVDRVLLVSGNTMYDLDTNEGRSKIDFVLSLLKTIKKLWHK